MQSVDFQLNEEKLKEMECLRLIFEEELLNEFELIL